MNVGPEWETLYRQLAPAGLRFANAILRDRSEAEEVLQDAFCRLLASPKWRRSNLNADHFGAILFTTIRRRSIDVLRRRARANTHLPAVAAEIESDDPRFEHDESQQIVLQLIEQLPPTWRDALRMRVIGGRSYREISHALECTPAQVRTWLYRARQQLAEQLRHRGILRETGSTYE